LVARGLVGVELAISAAHPGVKAALAQALARRGSDAPRTSSAICAATPGATSTTLWARSSPVSSPPRTPSRRVRACATPSNGSSAGAEDRGAARRS
jgi:hypothetical protein